MCRKKYLHFFSARSHIPLPASLVQWRSISPIPRDIPRITFLARSPSSSDCINSFRWGLWWEAKNMPRMTPMIPPANSPLQ